MARPSLTLPRWQIRADRPSPTNLPQAGVFFFVFSNCRPIVEPGLAVVFFCVLKHQAKDFVAGQPVRVTVVDRTIVG